MTTTRRNILLVCAVCFCGLPNTAIAQNTKLESSPARRASIDVGAAYWLALSEQFTHAVVLPSAGGMIAGHIGIARFRGGARLGVHYGPRESLGVVLEGLPPVERSHIQIMPIVSADVLLVQDSEANLWVGMFGGALYAKRRFYQGDASETLALERTIQGGISSQVVVKPNERRTLSLALDIGAVPYSAQARTRVGIHTALRLALTLNK